MSAIRACSPRVIRPRLSIRYQVLRRFESTASPSPAQSYRNLPPPPPPSFAKRNRWPIIWSGLALSLGLATGNFFNDLVAPQDLPAPGSPEDQQLLANLNAKLDDEFKVKVYRGKCLGVTKQLKGEAGGWVEIVPAPIEDQRIADDGLIDHMQGGKYLGVERIFWDRDEQRLIAIVWLGGALSGWPGVTHGGVLATVLTEKFALAAALAEGKNHSFSKAAIPQRMPGTGSHAKAYAPMSSPEEPAHLSLTYKKPAKTNNFYVIRVSPHYSEEGDDSDKLAPHKLRGGSEYEAILETLDAKTCILAKARFAPSSTAQKVEAKVIGGAQKGYSEFKEWMWPSRQKNSQI
ncbi:Hypothetical protein R9X50_00145100 [Acrodontium crateriforme]|uniref:Uncharacterized protein n=1 Tax=Acrodontium crateriforme TaxID=150365 RepID=A0AAQ3LZI4_9PEZI|nr:Hypothetical protein R9X50_00145100 [Acrodontium crateriforme]